MSLVDVKRLPGVVKVGDLEEVAVRVEELGKGRVGLEKRILGSWKGKLDWIRAGTSSYSGPLLAGRLQLGGGRWKGGAIFHVTTEIIQITHQATVEWKEGFAALRVLTLTRCDMCSTFAVHSLVLPIHLSHLPPHSPHTNPYTRRFLPHIQPHPPLPSSHSTSLLNTFPIFQSHLQETAMSLKINPFGWGVPTHDVKKDEVKKDVDSKVVTTQLDALRDSVNDITAALDNLPARVVAEIQVNDPKQTVSSSQKKRNPKCDAAIAPDNNNGQHQTKPPRSQKNKPMIRTRLTTFSNSSRSPTPSASISTPPSRASRTPRPAWPRPPPPLTPRSPSSSRPRTSCTLPRPDWKRRKTTTSTWRMSIAISQAC